MTAIVHSISEHCPEGRQRKLILHTAEKDRGPLKDAVESDRDYWDELGKFSNVQIVFNLWPFDSLDTGRNMTVISLLRNLVCHLPIAFKKRE